MVVLFIYNAQRESPSSDDEINNWQSKDTGNIENVYIYKNHLVLTFEFYFHIYKQRNVRKNEGKQKWTIYRFRDIGNFGHKKRRHEDKRILKQQTQKIQKISNKDSTKKTRGELR